MSKKSTTNTQTQAQTSLTTTPTNPAWVDTGLAGLGGRVSALQGVDPYSYVAGADPLQTQAAQAAGALTTSPGYGQASSIYGNVAGAGAKTYTPSTASSASLLDGLSSYMSPYTGQVVDSALKDYDFGAGQTQAQNKLALANDDTFGGSGGAIQTAMSNDAINRGRGTLSAQLNDQAFQVGAGLSSSDAQRRQETSLANMAALNSAGQFNATQQDTDLARQLAAAQGLTSTANSQDASSLANISAQSSLGDVLRQISQAQATAPLTSLAAQAGLWNAIPLNLLHGTTADGTSSGTSSGTTTEKDPIGQLSKLLAAIGSLGGGGGGGGGSAAAGG